MKRKESVDWKKVEDGDKSGILIVSKPSTAHVFIDAEDTEVQVGKLRIVSSGIHMLTIEEEGHEDHTVSFHIVGAKEKEENK